MRFDGSIRRTAVLALIAPCRGPREQRRGGARAERPRRRPSALITSDGSEIIDEGPATGTVPGKVRVHFIYNGNPAVCAQFTIYGHSGSISGRAKANLSNPTSPEPSFRGAFRSPAAAAATPTSTGPANCSASSSARGYALVVQTIGKLAY